ncbi:hypothetical protein BJ912DRAFT_1043493 [Pholiota molesta]|nr:hypothetical protein BJ912DRAFT_1043493 [Pholiota molesta]
MTHNIHVIVFTNQPPTCKSGSYLACREATNLEANVAAKTDRMLRTFLSIDVDDVASPAVFDSGLRLRYVWAPSAIDGAGLYQSHGRQFQAPFSGRTTAQRPSMTKCLRLCERFLFLRDFRGGPPLRLLLPRGPRLLCVQANAVWPDATRRGEMTAHALGDLIEILFVLGDDFGSLLGNLHMLLERVREKGPRERPVTVSLRFFVRGGIRGRLNFSRRNLSGPYETNSRRLAAANRPPEPRSIHRNDRIFSPAHQRDWSYRRGTGQSRVHHAGGGEGARMETCIETEATSIALTSRRRYFESAQKTAQFGLEVDFTNFELFKGLSGSNTDPLEGEGMFRNSDLAKTAQLGLESAFLAKELLLGLVVNTNPTPVAVADTAITPADMSLHMAYGNQQRLSRSWNMLTLSRKEEFDKSVKTQAPQEVIFRAGDPAQGNLVGSSLEDGTSLSPGQAAIEEMQAAVETRVELDCREVGRDSDKAILSSSYVSASFGRSKSLQRVSQFTTAKLQRPLENIDMEEWTGKAGERPPTGDDAAERSTIS